MAGSEKLYLQPILKELLDGINTAIGSVENIVDGLGDAVGDMKDAVDSVQTIVDGVSDTLTSVQGTLETTNSKLDTLNQSIGETKQMIVTPSSYTGTAGYIGAFTEDLTRGRYEQGDIINRFACMCDGSLTLFGDIHGTSGVNSNNPGLLLVDETTNISLELIEHSNNSGTSVDTDLAFGVVAGHTYRLEVESNGGSGEDLWIAQNTDCQIKGKIYYLTASADSNNVFVMGV